MTSIPNYIYPQCIICHEESPRVYETDFLDDKITVCSTSCFKMYQYAEQQKKRKIKHLKHYVNHVRVDEVKLEIKGDKAKENG